MSDALRLLVLICMTLAVSCAQPPPTAPEPVDFPRHELLLAHHGDGARKDYDVWRMCGDGTQLASLVSEPGPQFQIGVSPDGEEFVYASRVGDQWDLFRKSFRGGEATNVTAHPADDSQPAWSPDGRFIAFSSKRDSTRLQLYLLELETGTVERITENEHYDSGATFSHDGSQVIFTRYVESSDGEKRGGTGEIFARSLADGAEKQLTSLGGYSGDPGVSPDGETIAFHRVADGRAEIWLMNADGSHPRAITDTFIDEYTPEWSPDGKWLAITAGVGHDGLGTFDIWLLRPDGSARHLLNGAANTEAWHVWRPGEHYCR